MAASPGKSLPIPNLGRKTCKEQNHIARRQLPRDMRSEPSVCQWGSRGRRSPSARLPSGACTISASAWIKILHLCLHPRNPASSFTGSFGSGHISAGHRNWQFSAFLPYSFQMASLGPLFSLSYKMPSPLPSASLIGIVAWFSWTLVFPPYVLGWWPLQVIATGFMGKERDTQNRKLIFSRSRETQNGKITSP